MLSPTEGIKETKKRQSVYACLDKPYLHPNGVPYCGVCIYMYGFRPVRVPWILRLFTTGRYGPHDALRVLCLPGAFLDENQNQKTKNNTKKINKTMFPELLAIMRTCERVSRILIYCFFGIGFLGLFSIVFFCIGFFGSYLELGSLTGTDISCLTPLLELPGSSPILLILWLSHRNAFPWTFCL